MRYAALPPQAPIYPEEAANYARETLERSEAALSLCDLVAHQQYGADYWQAVDIYRPRKPADKPAPVLVFAHGGAWTNGYKEWMGLMAPSLTAAGIVFVSVSYRLAPEHRWNLMLDDCLDAAAWVHKNIQKFGGDPERLALGGHSAGGHLMALAALRPDLQALRDIPPQSIQACFPLCAPLDIRYPGRQPGSGEERTHQMILNDSSEASAASPICHVTESSPFVLLAYAKNDLPRIINSNVAIAAELGHKRVKHETLVLEGDHFSAALGVADERSVWTERVIQLLHS